MNVRKLKEVEKPQASDDAGKSLSIAMELMNTAPKEMCEYLDITRQHLHTMKGQKSINDARLKQIAEYYYMTPQEFLSLPRRPMSVMFGSAMRELTKMLREDKKPARFVLEMEAHADQFLDKLIMLENT